MKPIGGLLHLPPLVFPAVMLVLGYPTSSRRTGLSRSGRPWSMWVHSNTYRRMDGEELRRIFDGRTGGEEFCSWMQAFHRRKVLTPGFAGK